MSHTHFTLFLNWLCYCFFVIGEGGLTFYHQLSCTKMGPGRKILFFSVLCCNCMMRLEGWWFINDGILCVVQWHCMILHVFTINTLIIIVVWLLIFEETSQHYDAYSGHYYFKFWLFSIFQTKVRWNKSKAKPTFIVFIWWIWIQQFWSFCLHCYLTFKNYLWFMNKLSYYHLFSSILTHGIIFSLSAPYLYSAYYYY